MVHENLYRGRFESVGDRKLNSVRVFISSTFTDTVDERNGLIERVYPRLRTYCQTKYNIQFQYSDMRWGIPSSASNNHSTTDICLQELDSCCRLSLATNCVILLSHRYGSRLPPKTISYRLFKLFEASLSNDVAERDFLLEMYQCDENYLDKRYILRMTDDSQQRASMENKLQSILRKAADKCYKDRQITEEERDEFYISVTAKEIHHILKSNTNKQRRMICFIREIIDIDKLDGKYRDIDDQNDTTKLLDKLKNTLRQSLNSSDVYNYQVQWKNENKRQTYLSKFFDDFYEAIKSQIDFHMNSHEMQAKDNLFNQVLEHAVQCNSLLQRYFPRLNIMEQIKSYVLSDNNFPCVLFGQSGVGKSSIMAQLVREIPTWYSNNDSLSIIIRFLGTTPSASDIRRPLISIVEQICQIYNKDMPANSENIKETFENLLMNIPKNEKLIILLDSIDQLRVDNLNNLSSWLLTKIPSTNVKYIISTIPEIEFNKTEINILQRLKDNYDKKIVEIEITSVDEAFDQQVLNYWLSQDQRCLTTAQHELLKKKFSIRRYMTPLFISLLYDQTLTWRSYDQNPDPGFLAIRNTTDAIGYLYNQLGLKHGEILFRRSMVYLQLSGGLSEQELEDILSSDDEVLQSVFVHYLPPFQLFRLPSSLWIRIRNDMHKYLVEKDIDNIPCICFYHSSFQNYQPLNPREMSIMYTQKELAEKCRLQYFANQHKPTFDVSYSSKLVAKYKLSTTTIPVNRCLEEQNPFKEKKTKKYNLRRLHQLYININRYDFAHEWTVFNYEFLSAYLLCGEYKMWDLLYQFSIGALDPDGELRFLIKQLERAVTILNRYPKNLAFELIYRLSHICEELPTFTTNLLKQCVKHCPLQLITNDVRHPSLAQCLLSNIIAVKIDSLYLYVLTSDDQLYVFLTNYLSMFMINNISIKYEKTIANEKFSSFVCRFPYVCCFTTDSSLIVVNCKNGQVSMQMSCKKPIAFVDANTILVISSSSNTLELWNCATNVLVSKHTFQDNIIEDCIIQQSTIKIVFKDNATISYFTIDDQFNINSIRTANEKIHNYDQHMSIDMDSEFYYSLNKLQALLVIHNNQLSDKTIQNINFNVLPKSVIRLPHSNSIAWLSSKSVTIFHPIYDKKIFQPFNIEQSGSSIEYDYVHDHYVSPEFDGLTNFLACCNTKNSIIDIYEWRYDNEQGCFAYRRLAHIQLLEIFIERFVFTAYHFDGLVLYCSDGNTIYKYNATMLTYQSSPKVIVPLQKIDEILSIEVDQFIVTKDKNQCMKVFVFNNKNILDLRLSIQSIAEFYFTKTSSHILVVDDKGTLSLYALNSSKSLWTTSDFEHKNLQIHSLKSSFIIYCLQTRQISKIDVNSLKLEVLFQLSMDCYLSTIISDKRLLMLSTDPTNLIEFDLKHKTTIVLQSVEIGSTKTVQLYTVFDCLLLQTNDKHLYIWWNKNDPLLMLEQVNRFVFKDNRLVLVCTDNRTLIIYDLKEKLRGTIPLENGAGPCEAITLANVNKNKAQYLFVICHDRLLRMYDISNGQEIAKLFIHTDLYPFIGIVNDHLLLKAGANLCIIKMIDKKSLSKSSSGSRSPLLEQTMWMTCHQDDCVWSNVVIK